MRLKPHVSLAGRSNSPFRVGQSVQIGMKLELGVWHHPLHVYAKFQTDISQHVQKKSGKLFAGWEL